METRTRLDHITTSALAPPYQRKHGTTDGQHLDKTVLASRPKAQQHEHYGKRYERHLVDDFFSSQASSTVELPPPEPFIKNLALCVIEILSGVRSLNQISRWVDEGVYALMAKRVVLAERARRAKNLASSHPSIQIGSIICCEPRDGIIEASVVVHGKGRSRAIAFRIEGVDQRWRATALHVL
ncbi:MAG: Rv3235 family protein [Microbacteriaceae bacterium]